MTLTVPIPGRPALALDHLLLHPLRLTATLRS
jgi:hypothetical protein